MRESKAQAQRGGERAAVVRRTEQPDRRCSRSRGHRLDPAERVVRRQRIVEEPDEILHLLGETVGGRILAVGQRLRGQHVAAGRTAQAEVDASGEQGLQHAEHFCHLERAVVEQYAAAADADARGRARHAREQYLRTGIGERSYRMVLGEPVAVIAQRVGTLAPV